LDDEIHDILPVRAEHASGGSAVVV